MSSTDRNDLVSYENFMIIPITMYKIIGIDLTRLRAKSSFWTTLNFWIGLINLNAIIVAEFVFFYKAFGRFANFLEATAVAPCIGFCVMSDFKVVTFLTNIGKIDKVQKSLIDMYPNDWIGQEKLKIMANKKRITYIMTRFLTICLVLIWLFNFSAIGRSAVGVLLLGEQFQMDLPYFTWYPFEMKETWVYVLTYLHQMYAGHMAVTLTIGGDIFLCCMVQQLSMHFDRITNELREYKTKGTDEDLVLLHNVIEKHQILLRLCKELNDIFSPSIFFNFLASSLIICLVGFQATAGIVPLELLKYLLFLLGSSAQILVICYFSDILIDSSRSVATGAYENNWTAGNQKYKKLLLFIIARGQKAAALNALTFNDVCLASFNKICSISYQFFALLRTVYDK